MSFMRETQHEALVKHAVGTKSWLIGEAIQATTALLKRWCAGRFAALTPPFSRQMEIYWTPELQKERYHALELDQGCIEPLAYSDQTPSHVSVLYIYITCHYGNPHSAPRYSARIIVSKDGRIMAFYI